ncbi:NAD(P)-binding protein, partial [bacterium]|nr:NAD(P)-binding protein [bacterium]
MIKIAGAGISGLTAALFLAKAGKEVELHELTNSIGNRFGDDFQGIENWTKNIDVIEQFKDLGIPTSFNFFPTNELNVVSPKGKIYSFTSKRNFYYLIQRGKEKGRLDQTFYELAKNYGAKV